MLGVFGNKSDKYIMCELLGDRKYAGKRDGKGNVTGALILPNLGKWASNDIVMVKFSGRSKDEKEFSEDEKLFLTKLLSENQESFSDVGMEARNKYTLMMAEKGKTDSAFGMYLKIYKINADRITDGLHVEYIFKDIEAGQKVSVERDVMLYN